MDPDIAARLEDLQTLATFLVGTLFAVAVALRFGPTEPECDPECRPGVVHGLRWLVHRPRPVGLRQPD